METAISVKGLMKRYGKVHALKGVDLSVKRGCIYGLLGPNGAGKSTLIKSLVGSVRPNAGTVEVLGHPMPGSARAVRARVGYMPQVPAVYGDLSVRANVAFFAHAHRVDQLEQKVNETLRFVGLAEAAKRKVETLSSGLKQRCSLACALVHAPEILILDEPTAGVDPILKAGFWRHFRNLASKGTTILISTHLMDEPLLCDTVGILREGHLIVEDTPEKIMSKGNTKVTLKLMHTSIEKEIGSDAASLSGFLAGFGLSPEVEGIILRPESIEEIFLKLIEEKGHDQ